jgi:hypothetical protein
MGREDKRPPLNPVWGFENLEAAREYVARYLLNYISLELQGLPKEEWEKTLRVWKRICRFADSLTNLPDEKRKEIYRKNNFDMMMEGIAEDVRHTLIGMRSLGILKKDDPPEKLLERAVELVRERKDLLRRWEIDPAAFEFMCNFFTTTSREDN